MHGSGSGLGPDPDPDLCSDLDPGGDAGVVDADAADSVGNVVEAPMAVGVVLHVVLSCQNLVDGDAGVIVRCDCGYDPAGEGEMDGFDAGVDVDGVGYIRGMARESDGKGVGLQQGWQGEHVLAVPVGVKQGEEEDEIHASCHARQAAAVDAAA